MGVESVPPRPPARPSPWPPWTKWWSVFVALCSRTRLRRVLGSRSQFYFLEDFYGVRSLSIFSPLVSRYLFLTSSCLSFPLFSLFLFFLFVSHYLLYPFLFLSSYPALPTLPFPFFPFSASLMCTLFRMLPLTTLSINQVCIIVLTMYVVLIIFPETVWLLQYGYH